MPLKTIFIGVARRGKVWWQAAARRKDIEIAGLVDISESALQDAARDLGLPASALHPDLDRALAASPADVAVIATASPVHRRLSEDALAKGLHVIVEKPMATTMEDARGMAAAEKRSGRRLMVAQNYRFKPQAQAIRRLIHSGAIGRVSHALCSFRSPGGGNFNKDVSNPFLIEMAIHHFDTARHILAGDPVSVWASMWRPPWAGPGPDNAVAATFEFEGGLRWLYEGNTNASVGDTGWNAEWRIEGEKGSILLAKDEVALLRPGAAPEKVELSPPVPANRNERLIAEANTIWDEFLAALKEGRRPLCDAQDNLKSIGMVFSTIESAKTNGPVSV